MKRLIFTFLLLGGATLLPGQEAATPAVIDFEKATPGLLPSELMAVEGEFHIAEDAGNKLLEMHAAPVVDGVVLIGPSVKGAATIRAKIKAGKSRRAFSRAGIGLYGISGVKLRLVPAQKQLELVVGEETVATAPFETWKEDTWWQVELAVVAAGDGWTAEGRVWQDTRPEAPMISAKLAAAPGQGRGSLLGSPYANKPIQFDEVAVAPAK